MLTTIDIDDDALKLAADEAARRQTSIGATISTLIRRGVPKPHFERSASGLPILPRRPGGGPVTMAMVNELRDALD